MWCHSMSFIRNHAAAITIYVFGQGDGQVEAQLESLDMSHVGICLSPSFVMRTGASVSCALFVSLVSVVTKVSAKPGVAMTGEIGLW